MAYLELKMVDNSCISHQKKSLVNTIFHQFTVDWGNIIFSKFIFGEEPEKLTKMLPEPKNTILMSALKASNSEGYRLLKFSNPVVEF